MEGNKFGGPVPYGMCSSMNIAKKMKQVREARGMTMKETAQQIGVSASTYRDWEYGRKIPVSHATKISEVLSISLSDLVGEMKPKDQGQLLEAIHLIEEALKKLKACYR